MALVGSLLELILLDVLEELGVLGLQLVQQGRDTGPVLRHDVKSFVVVRKNREILGGLQLEKTLLIYYPWGI